MKINHLLTVTFCLLAFTATQKTAFAQRIDTLPDNVDKAECTVEPPAKNFDIAVKWKTTKYTEENDPYVHGRSTPIIADLNGDGRPEIIVPSSTKSAGNNNYALRPNTFITRNLVVLDGMTGKFKYLIETCDFQVHGQPICVADADKDGKAEIYILSIGARKTSSKQEYGDKYIYCYNANRKNNGPDDYKWKSDKDMGYSYIPMIADINNDGFVEVVCGGCVFNAITGKTLIDGTLENEGMGFGGPHNVHGGWQQSKQQELGEQYYLNALADIDGDKQLELCAGNTVYKYTLINPIGTNGNKIEVLRQCERTLPYDDMYDGQTFVLDFDNDGDLDVCVLGRNKNITNFVGDVNHLGIYVWEGQTNEMVGYFVCDPKTNSPSIPFAGDLDGDNFPEIIFNGWVFGQNYGAASNPDQMHVYKYEKGYTQNDRSKALNIKEPFTRAQCQEFFESAGFTVFDFNQDKKAEIVFRGEKNLYILDGSTLEKLCEPMAATSGTTAEYPVVADVDCDGHADIIFTEEYNPSNGPAGCCTVCESATPGAWGPARKVWNQWPYNVVNINEDLSVPQYMFDISTQFPNGTKPFNAFLQQATMLNSDGDMFIAAADAEIIHDEKTFQNLCNEFVINLTYTNSGSLMLNAPYYVTVYKDSPHGDVLKKVQNNSNLMVGDTTKIVIRFNESFIEQHSPISKIFVAVNDEGNGVAQDGLQQQECNLVNNLDSCDFDGLRTSEEFDNPVTICDGETYTVGDHEYSVSGDYIDTLKNQYGCDSIVKTHLTVSSIHFDFSTTRYCSEVLPVTLDASSCGAASYEWNTGATTPSIQANTNDGEGVDSWEYFVIVTNSDGCIDTSNTVTVYRNPQVEITSSIDKSQFCSVGEATLTADAVNMVNKSDVTWLWNTNETTPTISVETTHEKTFTVEATYNNCKGTASFSIDECPCTVELFNAFTPNGDGINDTFAPKLEATFKSYQLIIYDRWGKSVFKSEDPTESWDGTINGQNAADGVYYYVFTYACMSAPLDLVSKHGSITLIR